jgi:hypothetical protein
MINSATFLGLAFLSLYLALIFSVLRIVADLNALGALP